MAMLLALALAALSATGSDDPCAWPATADPTLSIAPRRVTARDLATLTDVGRSDPGTSPTPFGVSPDQRSIAFILRRANPDMNAYCQRLMIMPLDSAAPPRELARGGAFIRSTFGLYGVAAYPAGFERVVAPKWSPDGQTVAWLRKDDGPTQIWLVGLDGTNAHAVTQSADDIENFTWMPDGKGFVVATRPALRESAAHFADEKKTGYLLDARFMPMAGNEPMALDPVAVVYSRIELANAELHTATPTEAALLAPVQDPGWQKRWRQITISTTGNRARLVAREPARLLSPSAVEIDWADGRHAHCTSNTCEKVAGLWWSGDGRTLTFAGKVGWGRSYTGLFSWREGDARPKPLFVTQDALVGCTPGGDRIICAREGSLQPRRIVVIDLATGFQSVLLDPNPGFEHLRMGTVQRFRFRNVFGIECYADLVLPPDHAAGERHPMVVVQYNTDGFLRGSTGDEVPIQVLAAHGFAVLSFGHPSPTPSVLRSTNEAQIDKAFTAGFSGRRSVESALEIAVRKAIATGAVDTSRIGISGMSEGTSATQWALIHSAFYKVVSLGVCCEEQVSTSLVGGEGYARALRSWGYPSTERYEHKFWPQLSLVRNVDRINTPILVQAGGDEYQNGLYTARAFRDRGKPFDFYIMPDEPHIKWQPAHRLAMYERTTDWFAFWLLHQRDCSVDKTTQYTRWLAMRGAPRAADLTCWHGST